MADKIERVVGATCGYCGADLSTWDILYYVDMLYSPMRKKVGNGLLSTVYFEWQRLLQAEAGL